VNARRDEVRRLRRARPRNRFARATVLLLGALCVASWFLGGFDLGGLFGGARGRNLERFLSEAAPRTEGDEGWASWAGRVLGDRGHSAALTTLAISIAAMVLAGAIAALLAFPAARTLAHAEPFVADPRRPGLARRLAWRGLALGVRVLLVALRAIPEYAWAFLLLAVLGPTAWPAVLALAIHNAGILGRLSAETVENLERRPLAALRGLGAGRRQLAAFAAYPSAFGRFLLYFLYRWETCVREATVLGMLGILSLGWWIDDARVRTRYDEMLLWILVGALLVVFVDLLSAVARRFVRRAA
jgi:phosphonate transport system permease protein